MTRIEIRQRGFTLVELLAALTLATMVLFIAVPAFQTFFERARLEGAERQIVGDVRSARARAVATGWQYRITGFDAGSASTFSNQYRLLGRRSTADAWPDVNGPPLQSTTQLAGDWIDFDSSHSGVVLDATSSGDGSFAVTFDARGAATTTTFTPMNVSRANYTKTLTISSAGAIRSQ